MIVKNQKLIINILFSKVTFPSFLLWLNFNGLLIDEDKMGCNKSIQSTRLEPEKS